MTIHDFVATKRRVYSSYIYRVSQKKRKPVLSVRYLHCHASFNQSIASLSRAFSLLSFDTKHDDRGGSRRKKKGGGAQHTVFFPGPPPASKVAQVPKKLMSGGGGGGGGGVLRHFFRSATSVESRASLKRGGGGNPTHLCLFVCFLFFQKGGTCTKRGGKCRKKVSKRGARAGCAPLKSATV